MKYTKILVVAAFLPAFYACNKQSESEIKAKVEAEYQHKLDSMKLAEANAKIAAMENTKPAAAPAARPAAAPVASSSASCQYSWLSQRRVTASDIAGLSSDDISYLRNAIYAMHGRKFVKAKYRNFFSQFSWYTPLYDEVQLTSLEQQNVAFLKSYE